MYWYDYIFMIMSIILIALCLLQGGKTEGASGAITGGGLNVFVKTKERGSERVVSILTYIAAVVFFIFAVLIQVLASNASTGGGGTSSEIATAIIKAFPLF